MSTPILAGSLASNKFRALSRLWFVRKTEFTGPLGLI